MKDKELREQFSRLCKGLGMGYPRGDGLRIVADLEAFDSWSIAGKIRQLDRDVELLKKHLGVKAAHRPAEDILVPRDEATDGK